MTTARLVQGLGAASLLALTIWSLSHHDAPTSRETAPTQSDARPADASEDHDSPAHSPAIGAAASPTSRTGSTATGSTATAAATSRQPTTDTTARGAHTAAHDHGAPATAAAPPGSVAAHGVHLEHEEPTPPELRRAMSRVAYNPSGSPFGDMGCERERALVSGPLHFSDPTPEPLRAALEAATRDGHAITLVLRKSGQDYLASFGVTSRGAGSKETFFAGKTPTSVLLVPAFGEPAGISSNEIVERAYLLVGRGKVPVVLELHGLVWRASKAGSCDRMNIDVRGILPLSQYALPLPAAGGSRTVADVLGVALPPGGFPDEPPTPGGGQPSPASIHFTFEGTPSSFDFDTP